MPLFKFPSLFLRPDDLPMTTWMLLGACIQTALVLTLPRNIALLPAALTLLWRIACVYLRAVGIVYNPAAKGVIHGRTSVQIPNADGSFPEKLADKEVVVLLLGASSSHALGRFAPGFLEIGKLFQDMWKDAHAQREKWGFLGQTSTLLASNQPSGNTMLWLSYWKSLEHLHAFAHGPVHQKGWTWWNTVVLKKYPHMGIMHEVYTVPRGNWENIYHNFAPFGMGQTRYLVQDAEKPANEDGTAPKPTYIRGLQEVKGPAWRSMATRMGRPEIRSTPLL